MILGLPHQDPLPGVLAATGPFIAVTWAGDARSFPLSGRARREAG